MKKQLCKRNIKILLVSSSLILSLRGAWVIYKSILPSNIKEYNGDIFYPNGSVMAASGRILNPQEIYDEQAKAVTIADIDPDKATRGLIWEVVAFFVQALTSSF